MVYSILSCIPSTAAPAEKTPKKEVAALVTEAVLAVLLAAAGSLAFFGYISSTTALVMQGGAIAWIALNMVSFAIKNCKERTSPPWFNRSHR